MAEVTDVELLLQGGVGQYHNLDQEQALVPSAISAVVSAVLTRIQCGELPHATSCSVPTFCKDLLPGNALPIPAQLLPWMLSWL